MYGSKEVLMDEWVMESTDAYQRRYKYYKKKHPYEL
jgi:hypothetical protein